MSKTIKRTREHMRAWSRLFGGALEATEETVQAFIDCHQKKKYMKQSLERLQERGLIAREPTKYVVTKAGLRFFQRYYAIANVKPPKRWDGKWRVVSFDVPGEYRIERDLIRSLLKEFNFYQLQKSVWASPAHLSQDFWQALVGADLHEYCKTMLVEEIEEDTKLKLHFGV